MTVLELIAHLEQLPGSAPVLVTDEKTMETLSIERVEYERDVEDAREFIALYVDLEA